MSIRKDALLAAWLWPNLRPQDTKGIGHFSVIGKHELERKYKDFENEQGEYIQHEQAWPQAAEREVAEIWGSWRDSHPEAPPWWV